MPFVAVLCLFAVSRLLFAALGVRFDASPLTFFWQFLDVEQLRANLFASVFHLHAQPPLFSLFLGTVLKVAGTDPAPWFRAAFLLIGLGLHTALYALIVRLGVGRWTAVAFVGVFAFSPAGIVYENHLFYTYPVAAILTAAGVFLHRLAERGRSVDAVVFTALLATALWTRSVFHLLWFTGLAALAISVAGGARRRVAVAALAPALLAVGLYAKNWVVFGMPGLSGALRLGDYS